MSRCSLTSWVGQPHRVVAVTPMSNGVRACFSNIAGRWATTFGCACRATSRACLADRNQPESPPTDLIARPQELYVELVSEHADLRLGYSRVVWGRLDELQPTDVVNPLDLAKFFFEGRAEARMPVAMARARFFLAASTTLEALVVPQFRPGRFDQLDEPTSAFNLLAGIFPARVLNEGRAPLEAGRICRAARLSRPLPAGLTGVCPATGGSRPLVCFNSHLMPWPPKKSSPASPC